MPALLYRQDGKLRLLISGCEMDEFGFPVIHGSTDSVLEKGRPALGRTFEELWSWAPCEVVFTENGIERPPPMSEEQRAELLKSISELKPRSPEAIEAWRERTRRARDSAGSPGTERNR